MLKRLQTTPWSTIAGSCFMLAFFTAAARLATSTETAQTLRVLLLGAALVLVAAKYLSGLAGAFARHEQARAQGQRGMGRLLALQPPEVYGMQRHLARLLQGVWRMWRRQSPPEPPPGRPISFLRNSSYAGLAVVMCVLLVVEVPAGWAIMKASGMPAHKMQTLHSLLIGLSLAVIVLGLGDWYWLKHSQHALEHGTLKLRLGARFSADIAIADISAVEMPAVVDRPARSSAAKGLSVTPLDAPNVLLRLRAGALDGAVHFGCTPAPAESIGLYVDDPAGFMRLVADEQQA